MTRIQTAITTISFVFSSKSSNLVESLQTFPLCKNFTRDVHLHGRVSLHTHYNSKKARGGTVTNNYDKLTPSNSGTHSVGERPLDPRILTSNEYLDECVEKVRLLYIFEWRVLVSINGCNYESITPCNFLYFNKYTNLLTLCVRYFSSNAFSSWFNGSTEKTRFYVLQVLGYPLIRAYLIIEVSMDPIIKDTNQWFMINSCLVNPCDKGIGEEVW